MGTKVTEEDVENYNNSKLPRDAKEATAKNVKKGLEYEGALNTPYGKLLQKDLGDILVEELQSIVTYKHDSAKSISENYDSLMVHINGYQTAQKLQTRWVGVLKTKESALSRIKSVSEQEKRNH